MAALLVVGVSLLAPHAAAHSIDSATLTLTEVADGKFTIDWQTTAKTLKELREPAQYPKSCQRRGAELDCGPLGLTGSIEFPWLESGESRVIVLIDWLSGSRLLRVVNGRSPRLTVYGIPASAGPRFLEPIAADYTRLGVEHILTGFDHLMFVLAITILVHRARGARNHRKRWLARFAGVHYPRFLAGAAPQTPASASRPPSAAPSHDRRYLTCAALVQRRKALVLAITAFTLAHSLTLMATVLGWLWLPSAAVETTIALSIVLACAECLRPSDSLAHRAPWLVTFAFGLLHGMGFASVLLETGLPEQHVPSALLFFNVGVELGQLAAIAMFIGAGWLVTRIEKRPAWSKRAFVYAMGSMAAYWSLERGAAMFAR